MSITLKWECDVLNASNGEKNKTAIIPPGRHEIQRIPNPYGYPSPWLVLKGTLIGAAEDFWRWQNFFTIEE